jgi:hypothetical protein
MVVGLKFRCGWKAAVRSSLLNDRSAPIPDIPRGVGTNVRPYSTCYSLLRSNLETTHDVGDGVGS